MKEMSEHRSAQRPLILAFLKFVMFDFYDSDVGLVFFNKQPRVGVGEKRDY